MPSPRKTAEAILQEYRSNAATLTLRRGELVSGGAGSIVPWYGETGEHGDPTGATVVQLEEELPGVVRDVRTVNAAWQALDQPHRRVMWYIWGVYPPEPAREWRGSRPYVEIGAEISVAYSTVRKYRRECIGEVVKQGGWE